MDCKVNICYMHNLCGCQEKVKSQNASFKNSGIKKCQNLVGFHNNCHLNTVKNLPFYSFYSTEVSDYAETLFSDGK